MYVVNAVNFLCHAENSAYRTSIINNAIFLYLVIKDLRSKLLLDFVGLFGLFGCYPAGNACVYGSV